VYRYTSADGVIHEAKSDIGTGWIGGYETGRVVPIMIARGDPAQARGAGAVLLDIAGLVCLVPGVLFAYTALTAYPLTWASGLVAVAMLGYLGERAYRAMKRGGPVSLADWRSMLKVGAPTPTAVHDVKTIEEIRSSADFQVGQLNQLRQNRFVRPIVALASILVVSIGAYLGVRVANLEMTGDRAPGEVVSLHEEYSSDDDGSGYVYYPIVQFRTARGDTIQFKDNIGSDPPSFRVGDQVVVLFDPERPGRDVMIDHGIFWNALIPAILLLLGIGLVWLWFVIPAARPIPAIAVGKVNSPLAG